MNISKPACNLILNNTIHFKYKIQLCLQAKQTLAIPQIYL